MKLDLDTLKHVKFMFGLHSDQSSFCNGYRSLCRLIEEQEALIAQTQTPTPSSPYCQCKPCKESDDGTRCLICNKRISILEFTEEFIKRCKEEEKKDLNVEIGMPDDKQ